MLARTDLALECRELTGKSEIDGVEVQKEEKDNITITRILINNESGANALDKPLGKYITLEVPPFSYDAELFDGRISALADEISQLLPKNGSILIAGLGNDDITPDALGPQVVSMIFSTRHFVGEIARDIGFENLRTVSCVATGVLGKTGMESAEVIKGVVSSTKPCAVIVIDALASRSVSRLGCTVQISDSGIFPGSGVGNKRMEISERILGIPVVSIGVPTVIDASTFVCGILDCDDEKCEEIRLAIEPRGKRMMVTPREIDLITHRAAKYIAMGINCALNPELSPETMLSLVID